MKLNLMIWGVSCLVEAVQKPLTLKQDGTIFHVFISSVLDIIPMDYLI